MTQLVLIVPRLSKKVDIVKKKREIVSYVGTRLVEEAVDDVPGVLLKEGLSQKDKKKLDDLLAIEGSLVFINIPDDYNDEKNFITCNIEEEYEDD